MEMDISESISVIPKNSLNFLCRTCLLFTEIVNIKNFTWDGVKLEHILSVYTSVSKSDTDILPKHMCKRCIKKLYSVHRFLSNCKKSYEILQNIAKQALNEEREIQEKEIQKSSSVAAENDFGNDNNEDRFSENCDTEFPNEVKIEPFEVSSKVSDICDGPHTDTKTNGPNVPPFSCILCEISFNSFDELRTHKKVRHRSRQTFVCPYCKVTKRCDKESFLAHIRVHTGEKPNKCPHCDRAFNYKGDLKRHMGIHSNVKRFKCKFCSRGYNRSDALRDHERKHTGEKLICSVCGKGFHCYANLFVHERSHKMLLSNEHGLFQCNVCKKLLTTAPILKTHMLLHQPKEYGCEICGKMYITASRLEGHVASSHGEARYSCDMCDKVFKQKSYLEEHSKSHTGENVYPCKECNKRFACRTSLSQHRRIHTGDSTYQCKECMTICLNRRHLEGHMRRHTGDKPFVCDFCGKAFAIKGVLQHHVKIHTGEKKHLCNICGKGFSESRGLKRHLGVHQKDT